ANEGGRYNAYAITRPSDRTIALYPHCSRGKSSHVRNAAKWWFIGTSALLAVSITFFSIVALFHGKQTLIDLYRYSLSWVTPLIYLFFGAMTFSLTKKWMPFVRLSEQCFSALNWENPSDVDLVASTKKSRKENDPGELGVMYFRY
ncbi:MAG TPA: putative type VI secretion system effector, partial [Chitinolyticbacter sp.]|nr:putative type VI secretion system effector [Chitinolyticbacter sp.]